MSRMRAKPLTFKRVDSSGLYAVNRWNLCQAVSRALYVGPRDTEDIEKLFRNLQGEYDRATRTSQE